MNLEPYSELAKTWDLGYSDYPRLNGGLFETRSGILLVRKFKKLRDTPGFRELCVLFRDRSFERFYCLKGPYLNAHTHNFLFEKPANLNLKTNSKQFRDVQISFKARRFPILAFGKPAQVMKNVSFTFLEKL